jgi:hypothetical protein
LAYQPPASSNFVSQQTSHQQPASSTFFSKQTSTATSHQPTEQAARFESNRPLDRSAATLITRIKHLIEGSFKAR